MQLSPAAFNTLLGNMGEWFAWRKSMACPCVNPSSGSPVAGCPSCNGHGRIWYEAVRALAGVASSNIQQAWAKMGMYMSGDMVLSIPENSPLYGIAQFDRVLSETNTDPFSLALTRGAPAERLQGVVLSIDRVFWLDNAGALVDGGIPTVNAEGRLTWASGAPPTGKAYSISGVRQQEFYCFGAYSVDRMKHGGARLPRRMVLRKFDLFGRKGSL